MIRKTRTRARWAALTSGALIAGGLVVAPAVAGLSAATAAPVQLGYTCTVVGGGQTIPQDSTISIDVTVPASAEPGASVPTSIAGVVDMGSAAFGPITDLTGTFTIPVTVGGTTTEFVLPSSSAPVSALKFSGTATGNLTAPAAAGSSPITVGTVVGNLKTTPFGVDTVTTCVPDAGQDQTVGQLVVAEGEPATGFDYLCTLTFGGQSYPWDSTLTVEVDTPESVEAGEEFDATVDMVLDMGAHTMGPVSSLSGSVDLELAVGDTTTVVTIPTSAGTPESLRFAGTEEVSLVAPDEAGEAPISVGDATGNFTAAPVGMAISIPCVPKAGQDLTVGAVDVEEGSDPVAVPVTGKVKITGTPKAGKTLTAVPGKAAGATVTYRWLANGKAIAKATKPTLKLTKAMKGKKVSVRATYGKDGFLETVQTSKAVTVKK